MSKKTVDEQHSQTAIMAALYRAVSNKIYADGPLGPDYLAETFLPGKFRFFIKFKRIREKVLTQSDQMTPGGYEYVVGRTAFFDACFEKAVNEAVPQIVIMGAGYDSRAVRFDKKNVDSRIFELDIQPTQTRKRDLMRKAKIVAPENLTFASIDFNRDSIESVLEEAGFKKELKTLFLWEGVSMYLEPSAVDIVMNFFKNSGNQENQLVFDYAIPATEENMASNHGIREFVDTWKKHRTNEGFKFTLNEKEMETYLAKFDIEFKQHLNSQAIEEQYLTEENGKVVGKINGFFRFLVAGL